MVKIRLARRGRKKMAMFDLVVANATAPRDGRFIEKIGTYNPNTIPASINLNEEKALAWVMNGAQPTDTVRAILSYKGVLYKKHLQVGVLKGAISQEDADAKFEAWKSGKESKISGQSDSVAKAKADAAKARLATEAKVNEARIAAQAAKQASELAAAAPAVEAEEVASVAEAPAVEEAAPVAEAPAVEEAAPVAEAPAVEEATPVAEAPAVEEAAPVAEAPAVEEAAPVAEAPAVEEAAPASEEVVAEAPATEAAGEEPAAEA